MPDAGDSRQKDAPAAPPLSDAEIRRLLKPLEKTAHVAAAVSGGPDSTALMAVLARWRRLLPSTPPVSVLSVDHGLRPEAAAEAALVCRQAHALDMPCHVLRWRAAERDRREGLQARARAARYRLLGEWCAAHDAVLVTAHALEDQAETLLMRLRRGAGVDGLAAMAPRTVVPCRQPSAPPVVLLRPLLTVPRARLAATAAAAGLRWVEDPSNRDRTHERVRVRALLAALAGEGFTAAALARSARRLGRARAALDVWRDEVLARHLRIRSPHWGEIAGDVYRALPEEMRLRLLLALVARFGARRGDHPPRLVAAERLLAAIDAGASGRWRPLGGALFGWRRGGLVAMREPGRIADVLHLPPGDGGGVWDGRVVIEVRGATMPLTVVPLAATAVTADDERELTRRPADVPSPAWRAQPAVLAAGRLVALPLAGRQVRDAPFARLTARLAGAPPGEEAADDGSLESF